MELGGLIKLIQGLVEEELPGKSNQDRFGTYRLRIDSVQVYNTCDFPIRKNPIRLR